MRWICKAIMVWELLFVTFMMRRTRGTLCCSAAGDGQHASSRAPGASPAAARQPWPPQGRPSAGAGKRTRGGGVLLFLLLAGGLLPRALHLEVDARPGWVGGHHLQRALELGDAVRHVHGQHSARCPRRGERNPRVASPAGCDRAHQAHSPTAAWWRLKMALTCRSHV